MADRPDLGSRRLRDIDVADLRAEYRRRGLGSLSDADLVRSVAGIVAQPRKDPADSFVLHAPLELAARAALLPHVEPEQRHLARLHLVALAGQYGAIEAADLAPRLLTSPADNDSAGQLAERLIAAISTGDLDEVDVASSTLAMATTARELVDLLADFVVPLTAAAAHAPIFLYHLTRAHPAAGLTPLLLRPLARELARQPDHRLRWIEDWEPEHREGDEASPGLAEALAATPLLGTPGSSFIHPLLMQVDEAEVAAEHLGPVLRSFRPATTRAVLRIAARSMLEDDPTHAPYGWSHCLTLPQAVLGLARHTADTDRLLAIAATQVLAFRAGLGARELAIEPDLDQFDPVDPTALASAAATSHDAHVVKYTLACLEAADADREAANLYLAAAKRLLDIWDDNGGDPTDPFAD